MTLSDLVEKIEGHAPGSMIPRDWILEELSRATGEAAGVDAWVDGVRAAEITGEPVERLRDRATTWRGMPNPPIRVTKNDPTKLRSPWLFAEEDCWRYAREHGRAGPGTVRASVDEDQDPDDEEAITQHYIDKATANL